MSSIKLAATLKRFQRLIESVDDERNIQNGYWVNLRNGFIDTESGCHAIHESTLADCAAKMQYVERCDCDDCAKANND